MPPRLVAAWPPDGSVVGVAAQTLELTFNRPLNNAASRVLVTRADDGTTLAAAVSAQPGDARRLLARVAESAAGEYLVRWTAVAAGSGASASGDQTFSMRQSAVPPPHLSVSPADANTGDIVQINGRGFAAHSQVTLTIGDDGQPFMVVSTDQRGTFSADARVPSSVASGEQPVAAVDAAGAAGFSAFQVRWGGWPPLVAYTDSQPGPRSGEVTFVLSVRNRSDYVLEGVRFILTDPAGATFASADAATQHRDGRLVWDIPALDRGAAGPVAVTYRVEGPTQAQARITFRHRRPRGCSGDECLSAFVSETTSSSAPVFPAP